MRRAGVVTGVNLYAFRDNRSKGCGIVSFENAAGAAAAIATLNDVELGGRKLQVREDREGPAGPAHGERPARAATAAGQGAPPLGASSEAPARPSMASGACRACAQRRDGFERLAGG